MIRTSSQLIEEKKLRSHSHIEAGLVQLLPSEVKTCYLPTVYIPVRLFPLSFLLDSLSDKARKPAGPPRDRFLTLLRGHPHNSSGDSYGETTPRKNSNSKCCPGARERPWPPDMRSLPVHP